MTHNLIVRKQGLAGWITLNRPDALNALSHDMVNGIAQALDAWRNEDDVKVILIDGAGDRSFCAGGDVKEIYQAGNKGQHDRVKDFLATEYRLNAELAEYPIPIVSFLHGIVMGGGVGIGCHVSHRVIDTDARVAMPECRIGLVPDVGGSLLLANAPGRLGEYMALCGTALSADEAVSAGFADHLIAKSEWDDLKRQICVSGDPDIVAGVSDTPAPLPGVWMRQIDAVFGGETVEDILAASSDTDFIDALQQGSPISLSVTLDLIRRAREFSNIREALEHEFRFMARATEGADGLEGIRAVVIDRDNKPAWRYSAAQDVASELIGHLTSPLDERERLFPIQISEEVMT